MFRNRIRRQISDRGAFGLVTTGISANSLLAAFLLAAAFGSPARAALSAAGDITYVQVDASTYRYSLDLKNTGTTTIGTFWYSWLPGEDFLPTMPTNVVAPAGWTDQITGGGAGNGFAIEFVANTPIAAGTVLSGFGFDSADTPAQLSGNSPTHASTPVATTDVYTGAPLVGSPFTLSVAPVADPWSNPLNAVDVNHDGAVTPIDALQVINALNTGGSRTLALPPQLADGPPPFIDTNGDGKLSPIDALQVINALNAASKTMVEDSLTLINSTAVPEPSSMLLAALGFGLFAAAGIARRIRRR